MSSNSANFRNVSSGGSRLNAPLRRIGVYLNFVRRNGRRFLAERMRETGSSIAPAPRRPRPQEWSDDALTVAWLGHATVLINFFGTWILTDPALRNRVGVNLAGGLMTVGMRRLTQPALKIRELPPIDLVIVSHAHMDHCDLATLRRLPRGAHAVVQKGNADLVKRFNRVDELAWGEATTVAGAHIEAIEVNHWGARKLTDRHRGYGGFLIEKRGRAIVFGGDTAYTKAFARLRGRAKIDLAILPIGAYDPFIAAHANPEQSWEMSRDMGATYILPMHHSTFRLSREPKEEPIRRMLAAAGDERWRVVVTEIGQTWSADRRTLERQDRER
jgi:L-ascorbate metabolism protein UlaG (beta-lactamase superfamily)